MAGASRWQRAAVVVATLLAAIGAGLWPAASLAMRVTIGTPTAGFGTGMSLSSCSSCTQYQLAAPGYQLTVPADGVITTWRVAGRGPLALRVLRPSGGSLIAVATRPEPSFASTALTSFQVNLPVSAGDQIGVDLLPVPAGGKVAQIRFTPLVGAVIGQSQPAVPDGSAVSGGPSTTGALSLNADVDITPVAGAIDVSSGPTTGGTPVTITGSYLDGVTSVFFGGAPAPFTFGPSGQLLVKAPSVPNAGPVDVQVRGPGGTSTLHGAFTYIAPPATSGSSAPPPTAKPPAGSPAAIPVISRLSLLPTAFRAAASDATPATGTRLAYFVSVGVTTRFDVSQRIAGRLVPGRGGQGLYCHPARYPVPAAARCTRYVALSPGFRRQDLAGGTVTHFSGRLGAHVLTPGSYRLTATATDAEGNRSLPVTHAFRTLAPPLHR